jgi:hypothetical protein
MVATAICFLLKGVLLKGVVVCAAGMDGWGPPLNLCDARREAEGSTKALSTLESRSRSWVVKKDAANRPNPAHPTPQPRSPSTTR